MLKQRTIIYHLRRHTMSNVYISRQELESLIQNLTTTELRLYNLIHNSILENPSIDYFSDANLASILGVSTSSISNAKSGLKQKEYMLLVRFKDETGVPCMRVVVGKEQVELYNMGIKSEITNLKAYNQLKNKFRLLDPSLTADEQAKAVVEFNEYFKEHKSEFN